MEVTEIEGKHLLIYAPGMFADGRMWSEVVPHVKNCRQLVIPRALCAYGNSVVSLKDQLSALVQEQDQPVTLVANSLGSLLCLMVAKELPWDVEQVIISGSAGFEETKLDSLGFKMNRHDARDSARQLAELIGANRQVSHQPRMAEVVQRLEDTFEEHQRSIMRLMVDANKYIEAEELIETMPEPVEVSAIWGDSDVITPLDTALGCFAREDLDLDVIEGAGHSPMVEEPRAFAEALNRRLN